MIGNVKRGSVNAVYSAGTIESVTEFWKQTGLKGWIEIESIFAVLGILKSGAIAFIYFYWGL